MRSRRHPVCVYLGLDGGRMERANRRAGIIDQRTAATGLGIDFDRLGGQVDYTDAVGDDCAGLDDPGIVVGIPNDNAMPFRVGKRALQEPQQAQRDQQNRADASKAGETFSGGGPSQRFLGIRSAARSPGEQRQGQRREENKAGSKGGRRTKQGQKHYSEACRVCQAPLAKVFQVFLPGQEAMRTGANCCWAGYTEGTDFCYATRYSHCQRQLASDV